MFLTIAVWWIDIYVIWAAHHIAVNNVPVSPPGDFRVSVARWIPGVLIGLDRQLLAGHPECRAEGGFQAIF